MIKRFCVVVLGVLAAGMMHADNAGFWSDGAATLNYSVNGMSKSVTWGASGATTIALGEVASFSFESFQAHTWKKMAETDITGVSLFYRIGSDDIAAQEWKGDWISDDGDDQGSRNQTWGAAQTIDLTSGLTEGQEYTLNIWFKATTTADGDKYLSNGSANYRFTFSLNSSFVQKYYIAGNGKEGGTWCCGKDWVADACPLDDNGSITFSLEPGSYEFKLTDGTWNNTLGYDAVNSSCSSTGYIFSGADRNIRFDLAQQGDVTITLKDGRICLKGDFKQMNGSAVPSECTDVLMQGFYFNSYEVNDTIGNGTNIYGDTRWNTLYAQSAEIGAYFDLIWLPPSALASGTGYHPRQYSNQNSDWGTRAELERLIASFHNSGTKVVADMVINHTEAMASWCDFAQQNFGEYGVYQPSGSFICKDDEMNQDWTRYDSLANDCWGTASGPNDDGTNYTAARDWAHNNDSVRKMMRSYAQWMRQVMHYDGFRYDECKGYHQSHINDYNAASDAYISFMEYWSGNSEITTAIYNADYNTMALDFQTKYKVFDEIARFNYANCRVNGVNDPWSNSGLLGCGWSKYAITFVDSHDWFYRGNNQEFGCVAGNGYNGVSMSDGMKDRLLQAIAYQLSMPGVPCVFYPHWYKYKDAIKDMIHARKLAGVHSESQISDEEVSGTGYKATAKGKNGNLILMLGDKTIHDSSTPGYEWLNEYNYRLVAKGNGYAMWVSSSTDVAPRIMATPDANFEDNEKGIQVTMKAVNGSCDNPTIYYTTDGTVPTTSSSVYKGALTFKQTTTLKAIAVCGTAQSKVQTYTYTYREPLQRGIQVHFQKPEQWEKVYFYAWIPGKDSEGNATSENIMGAFPGQRIYQAADGWYSYEFDLSLDSVNFCISSGNDCGKLNVRSNDLVADYDVYYSWEPGYESESKYEKLLTEKVNLDPDFDLVISPESGNFRSLTEGQTVTLTVVGKQGAQIYYTTDGSDPSNCPEPMQDNVSFTIRQTTTVRAYAAYIDSKTGKEVKTRPYTNTYIYKAPQEGPITVNFVKPHNWENLYLYAFTRVKKGTRNDDTPYSLVDHKPRGKSSIWPGMKWTTVSSTIQSDSTWYTYTFPDNIHEIYIIFTEGKGKPQSQDIYLAENTCYVWNADCGKAVVDEDCDGVANGLEDTDDKVYQLDPNQPMYNILGMPVDKNYRGIIIQKGHKFLIL